MSSLQNHNQYPKDLARKVNLMSPLAIQIANRWMMGWPETVMALISQGEYLPALTRQEHEERKVLAESTVTHLAQHEIVQESGLSLAPPSPTTT